MNVEQKRQELKKRKQDREQKRDKVVFILYSIIAILFSALTIVIYLWLNGYDLEDIINLKPNLLEAKEELNSTPIDDNTKVGLNTPKLRELKPKVSPLEQDIPPKKEEFEAKQTDIDSNYTNYSLNDESILKENINTVKERALSNSTISNAIEQKPLLKVIKVDDKEIKMELIGKTKKSAKKIPKIEMVIKEYRRHQERLKSNRDKKKLKNGVNSKLTKRDI